MRHAGNCKGKGTHACVIRVAVFRGRVQARPTSTARHQAMIPFSEASCPVVDSKMYCRMSCGGGPMKAAVCYEFGAPLQVEDVDLAPPQQGEVRVRVAATAICHSDVHRLHGEWGGKPPLVAGHETAGVVEEVGEGVTLVRPGDQVVVTMLRSCGRCFYCTSGSPNL